VVYCVGHGVHLGRITAEPSGQINSNRGGVIIDSKAGRLHRNMAR